MDGKLSLNYSMLKMYDEKGNPVRLRSQCPAICKHCTYKTQELDTSRVPVRFEEHRTLWGVIVMTVAVLGLTLAFVCMLFFIFKFKHPVVVGSTSSLSFILLLGIMLLYVLNFAIMFSDSATTCGIRRFGLGFFYTLCFTALLMKIVRISRIFNKAHVSGKPSFVGGPSNSFAAFILLLIELVLVVEWLVLDPPEVAWHLENLSGDEDYPVYKVEWRCVHSKQSLVISLIYVFILIFITLCIACNACRAAEFNKEAKYILAATIGTILIVIAWTVVYMIGPQNYEKPALCIGITANASYILILLFAPKMISMTSPDRRGKGGARSSSSLEYDATYVASRDSRDVGK